MDETVDSIGAKIADLRRRHAETLSLTPQAEIIQVLSALANRWRDPSYPLRLEAETWTEPFPFLMVQVSLDALLDSLTPDALGKLIAAENVSEELGYPVIGHVIAGNTPLLAWVSIIRALLVRSASLVKLPSNASARWADAFRRSLAEVAPAIAACVAFAEWLGGTTELDAALCAQSDLVIAHGSDATLEALRALCPPRAPFVGYGHRVSFGLVLPDADREEAALCFAKDILLYDQGGCLSPQTLHVISTFGDAKRFSAILADALAAACAKYPLPIRAASAPGAVLEARALALMEENTQVWSDTKQRWTVIARPQSTWRGSPTYGVVSVQPLLSLQDLPEAVAGVAGRLQGCAVAGDFAGYLPGVSYLCKPGMMQAPPLNWRQDGRDVLRVLLPAKHQGSPKAPIIGEPEKSL